MFFFRNGIFIKTHALVNDIIEKMQKNNGIVITGDVLPKMLSGVICSILYDAFINIV